MSLKSKLSVIAAVATALVLVPAMAFAQETASNKFDSNKWLAAAAGFAIGIAQGALDTYQNDALSSAQLILSNLRRAGQLIKSFKQVAVDQSSEQAREVNLKAYLEEILVSLGPALKKTPHTVTIKCPDELRLVTYPGAISQIVVNLVMNSLAHAYPDGAVGTLTITVIDAGPRLHIRYEDDGVGMDSQVASHLFEPFYTTRNGGLGLGLTLCESLAQAMGAHLSLAPEATPPSAAQRGAEFVLTLNVAPPTDDR